jgi:hypothetical protein
MFLDYHRKSVGTYAITADVKGSMGEGAHVQVGRFHACPNRAIAAAQRLVERMGYRYVVVTNRNTGWRFTVTDADASTTVSMLADVCGL